MRRWGCPSQKLPIVSRQANERRKLDRQDRRLKPREMGLQVPRRIHTQRKKKGAVQAVAKALGRGTQDVGAAKEKQDRRRAPDS